MQPLDPREREQLQARGLEKEVEEYEALLANRFTIPPEHVEELKSTEYRLKELYEKLYQP